MKRIYITLAAALLYMGNLPAQNTSFEEVLDSIEVHNPTLQTLRDQRDAQQLENRTGMTLPDPEVEFAYLWGSPQGIPGRTDLSVRQSFDMPTLLGMRSKVATGQNRLLDLQYKQERIGLLLEAKNCLVDLVYANALLQELQQRYRQAQTLAEAYRTRLHEGDVNALEANKIELNLASAKAALQQAEVERESLQKNLQRLNGGLPVAFTGSTYSPTGLAENFHEWYAQAEGKNPLLSYVQEAVAVGEQQVKLNKAKALPAFSVGYTSELIKGQDYRGVSVGMSIPLWSNRNRVKQARTALKAAESRRDEARQQFYYALSIQYEKAKGLQQTATDYRTALEKTVGKELLQKALEAGQISLLDYLMEQSFYYTAIDQALQAERDYQRALAELQAVEL